MTYTVMFDTMIFDAVIEQASIMNLVQSLIVSGQLEIKTTHLQEDQLSNHPDKERLAIIQALPTKKVPTKGIVWDLSRFDEAEWGDETTNCDFSKLTKGNSKNAADALITMTALSKVSAFVTEDRRAAKCAKETYLDMNVLTFSEFVKFLESLEKEAVSG